MTISNNPLANQKGLVRASIPVQEYEGAELLREKNGTDPMILAIQQFQMWIFDLQRKSIAYLEPGAGHILHIKHDVMQRFFLGIAESHIFLGIPSDEMLWFQDIPWLHVALRKGSDRLNIVSEETSIQNVILPYFALAFHVDNDKKINMLSRNKNLHIREISLDQYGDVIGVSQRISFTISIVNVEDDRNITGLLFGKEMSSSTNRSVIRKAYK